MSRISNFLLNNILPMAGLGIGLLPMSAAEAELLSVPSAFGPATLTRDTDTNLDWLDYSFTSGLSVNQALSLTQPGEQLAGFRLATLDEWISFSGYGSADVDQAARGLSLVSSMGCTPGQCDFGTLRLDGIVLENPASASGWHGAGVILQEGYGNVWTGGPYIQSMSVDPDFANPGYGAFLIAAVGSTPNNPWLAPGVGQPIEIVNTCSWTSDTNPCAYGVAYVDPVFAVGYDYMVDPSGPLMTSVLVPSPLKGGDQDFELIVNGISYALHAGTTFDLTTLDPRGLDAFAIRGIDISEGIDPEDPLGFVTGLTFSAPGHIMLNMTPFTESSGVLPEPSTWLTMIIGFFVVGSTMRGSLKPGRQRSFGSTC